MEYYENFGLGSIPLKSSCGFYTLITTSYSGSPFILAYAARSCELKKSHSYTIKRAKEKDYQLAFVIVLITSMEYSFKLIRIM